MNTEDPYLILLAGGKSSRMGFPKGLLPYNNTYWILEQISRFQPQKKGIVYIGLGFDASMYFEAIPWFKDALKTPQIFQKKQVTVVLNSSPELGPFSTLQSVLKMVKTTKDVVVLPIDIPLIGESEFKKISVIKNTIVIPNYEGKNGHPVKLSYHFWKQLLQLNLLDSNARLDLQIKLRKPSEITLVAVKEAVILQNLNTPEVWRKFHS